MPKHQSLWYFPGFKKKKQNVKYKTYPVNSKYIISSNCYPILQSFVQLQIEFIFVYELAHIYSCTKAPRSGIAN